MKMNDWLKKRALNPALVIGMGISEFIKNGKTWIKIPFFKNGQIVNNKYRCTNEKAFYQDAEAEKCFYNQDVIYDDRLKSEPLIITEGEVDAWSSIQAGFLRTVSVPDGAPNRSGGDGEKYNYLWDVIPAIRAKSPHVIIAVDNDKNGQNLAHDLATRIGKDFCKFVKYPKNCKDLNDALMLYGESGVLETIKRAQWFNVDGVFTLDKLPPMPDAKIFETGMTGFEQNFKLRLGDFSVVTGIPSHGKSTFVNDLMARVAQKHNLNICFASLEQHPTQDHLRNLRRWYIAGRANVTQEEADKWINQRFTFIYPTDTQRIEDSLSVTWFLERAAAAVTQYGANVIVLDPWNELEHETGQKSITEYVGSSIRRLKSFAKMMNVHVMVVAHPAKQFRDKDGKIPRPSLYSISDSAHWANKADIGIVVHRPDDNRSDVEIVCAKSRYHDIIGRPGLVNFKFNSHLNRYECTD